MFSGMRVGTPVAARVCVSVEGARTGAARVPDARNRPSRARNTRPSGSGAKISRRTVRPGLLLAAPVPGRSSGNTNPRERTHRRRPPPRGPSRRRRRVFPRARQPVPLPTRPRFVMLIVSNSEHHSYVYFPSSSPLLPFHRRGRPLACLPSPRPLRAHSSVRRHRYYHLGNSA